MTACTVYPYKEKNLERICAIIALDEREKKMRRRRDEEKKLIALTREQETA